jgi:hypothetical protein
MEDQYYIVLKLYTIPETDENEKAKMFILYQRNTVCRR